MEVAALRTEVAVGRMETQVQDRVGFRQGQRRVTRSRSAGEAPAQTAAPGFRAVSFAINLHTGGFSHLGRPGDCSRVQDRVSRNCL